MTGRSGLPTSRGRNRYVVVAALTAASLITMACGSTVPREAAGTPENREFGAPRPGPASPSAERTLDGDQVGGASGLPTEPAGSTGGRTGSPTINLPTQRVRGVTQDQITLGVYTIKNGEALAQGLGTPVSFGDTRGEAEALIKEINSRGGIVGRRIKPVWGEYDVTGDRETQMQALCELWTQDSEVFAVIFPDNLAYSVGRCMAKRRVPLMNVGVVGGDDQYFAEVSPWLRMPSMKSTSRWPRVVLPEAARAGFFGKAPRIGLFVVDDEVYARVATKVVRPLLKSLGYEVAQEARVAPSDLSSGIAAAVLQFKTADVTHVIFLQASGFRPLVFMQNAESQQYRPRYLLTSYEAAGALLQENAPAAQQRGAMGIGWIPSFDVQAGAYPTTPTEQRCFDVIRPYEDNLNRTSNVFPTLYCEMFWAFEAAALKAGRDLTPASFIAGYKAVAGTYKPVTTFVTEFNARTDGSTAHRRFAFIDECRCYRYTSGLLRDPS